MLPNFDNGDFPEANETADTLDSYAGVVSDALAEVPARNGGVAYLPTERSLRACQRAVELLRSARDGLDQCGRFWALLGRNGTYHRPVDRVRWALEALAEAAVVMAEHQGADETPATNRMRLMLLGEAVRLANEDLQGLLARPIRELSFPSEYVGEMD